MLKTNPITVNGMHIFDRNNPNFEIVDTNEEIRMLFMDKWKPVPVVVKNKIIGIVSDTEFWFEHYLLGDLYIFNQADFQYQFENYMVTINVKTNKIIEVNWVSYTQPEEVVKNDWMELVPTQVTKELLKRPSKHSTASLYRDYPHKTINGKGLIARTLEGE